MGVLTDFFSAQAAELTNDLMMSGPSGHFPTLECKSVDVVKLAQLEAIVRGMNLQDVDAVVSLIGEPAWVGGKEGPWVFEVYREVISAIQSRSDVELNEIANTWFATEEWSDWDEAECWEFWEVLVDFVREHGARGKVYCWMSL